MVTSTQYMTNRILITLLSAFMLFSCQNDSQSGSWLPFFSKNYSETIKVKVYSNSILIPVTIGNKIRYFQLDTGAPTSISPDLFAELGLQVSDSVMAIDYYNNQEKVYVTTLPELEIGGIEFSEVKSGIVNPIQSFSPCNQIIDGCLGIDIFLESALQIDIRKKEIVIASSIELMNTEENYITDLKLMFPQKLPFITVYFPELHAAEEVLFDTGSNNRFYRLRKSVFNQMLENKLITSKNILDTLSQLSNSSGLFGKQKDTVNYTVQFDNLTLAEVPILNSPTETFDSSPFSILGAPVLQLGIVSIDFANKKFYLNPYNRKPIDLSPTHGLTLAYKNEQVVVKSVGQDSEAGRSKIKEGYVLKKLNSVRTDSLSLCDYFHINWNLERSRDEVRYTFLTSENEELNVKIKN